MSFSLANRQRYFRLDIFLIVFMGLAAGFSLVAAVSMETKWTVFILFVVVSIAVIFMLQEREKFLFYLSVVLTSVYLNFHPIFIESAVFPWPISGFRITVFEVVFFFLFLSWMIRLVTDTSLKVHFYPWITIPFLLIWGLSLAGISRVTMPGVIKFSNMWLLLESWLIFLYFANNIRDRRMVYNVIVALLITGLVQSVLGLAQYITGGSLGLTIFGESKSYNVMMVGAEYVSRVSGTFGHPNSLAGYLATLVLISLALFWAPISRHLKLLLLPVFLVITTTLILTFSRGAWLTLGLGSAVTLYLCFLRRSKSKAISFVLSAILLLVFSIGSVSLIGPLKRRLFEEDYGAARARIPMTQVALNVIQHHPWLGVGLGNYTFEAPHYDISREGISYEFPRPVHNEFLLIAAEQGLPALVLFLTILLFILLRLLSISRSRDDPIMAYIAIGLFSTYFGWCVFRQTDYTYSLLGDPFWVLAGLSVAIERVLDVEPEEIQPECVGSQSSS